MASFSQYRVNALKLLGVSVSDQHVEVKRLKHKNMKISLIEQAKTTWAHLVGRQIIEATLNPSLSVGQMNYYLSIFG
jgi:hypothetical protein